MGSQAVPQACDGQGCSREAGIAAHSNEVTKLPRTSSRATSNGRRGRRGAGGATTAVVTQITQIVAANEALQRQVRELNAENERLRRELTEIGTALGRLSGGPRRRGRGAAAPFMLAEPKPMRQRRPITDPDQLERRRQALAKARAARAEKLKAARSGAVSE